MTLQIRGPLSGPLFRDLLLALLPYATTAGMTASGFRHPRDWVSRARPHLVSRQKVTVWPGVVSLRPVRLYEFAYTPEFVEILWQGCQNIVDFQERGMPDNLHCLDPAGRVVLGSVTLDGDVWTELTVDEWADVVRARPSLHQLRVVDEAAWAGAAPDGGPWSGWRRRWLRAACDERDGRRGGR